MVPESQRSYPAAHARRCAARSRRCRRTRVSTASNTSTTRSCAARRAKLVVEQDPHGHDIPSTQRTRVNARRGSDVVLSIDENLQWEAEYALLDQVRLTNAKGGMAALIDTTNGDVLAMASVHGAVGCNPGGSRGSGRAQRADDRAVRARLDHEADHALVGDRAQEGHTRHARSACRPRSRSNRDVQPFFDAEWHPQSQWTTSEILRRVVERRDDRDRATDAQPGARRRRARVRHGYEDERRLARAARRSRALAEGVLRHREVLDGDRLRRRGHRHADARRVHDDRQRGRDPPAASSRRDDRRQGQSHAGNATARYACRVGRRPRRR